jgi:DNA-binding winged helix-turn-helix (wHTH) protein/predicted ATPase
MLYCFGTYECDTDRRELYCVATLIRLEPKVFDLLVYLIEHRTRAVSRDELYTHLWSDTHVSDASLSYCISAARKAVGDNGRTQRIIKTMHGHGYAFVLPVTVQPQRQEQLDTESRVAPAGWLEPMPTRAPAPAVAFYRSSGPSRGALPGVERRQLTVLWGSVRLTASSDCVGETADRSQIMHEIHTLYGSVVRRFEGYIAQMMPDGYVSYFGYPLAHEDAARRAVYAGLALVEECSRLAYAVQPYGLDLSVSVGVHTGMVIMAALESDAPHAALAQGKTPYLAAQLADLAAANTVVISPATLRLVAGYAVTTPLGMHILDEPTESLDLYRVVSAQTHHSRLDAANLHGLTAFVGRRHEIGLLGERWMQSQDGMGQAVLISGEAGIGKSRLVRTFCERLGEGTVRCLECRCSPYTQAHTLHPVLALVQHCLGWQPTDSVQTKRQSLAASLQASSVPPEQAMPLLAPLFSLAIPGASTPAPSSVEEQGQHIQRFLLNWLLAQTVQQPVCLIVEDAHWSDPATLAFLSFLIEQMPTVGLLLLVTYRPEWTPPWPGRSHITPLTLGRLTQRQTAEMLVQMTYGKALPAEISQLLLEHTNGVPLFVEEMIKMVLESGLVKETERGYTLLALPSACAIPTTLHDLLMARLDHQGHGKLVAQLGAMLDRDFTYEALAAIAPLDEATLQAYLAQLVEAEIIYQRGLPPQAQYTFKHALIQETASQSLLKRTRRHYHRIIAETLTTQFPDTAALQPAHVAHHYTEAGQPEQAATYWLLAGQQAGQRVAHAEAITYLQRGLAVIESLPDTVVRWQHALALHLALGPALITTQGYAAPEVEHVYRRAAQYCQQLDDEARLFPVLRGLWLCYLVRGHLDQAQTLGTELCHLAEQRQEASLMTEAHRALGTSSFFRGDHVTALVHLEQSLAMYDTQQHGTLARSYGQDTGVLSQGYMAWSWWLRGYPERSQRVIDTALTLAQDLQHVFSLACALTFAAVLQQCRRNVDAVHTYVSQGLQLAQQYDFPLLKALGTAFQGWAYVQQDRGEAGIAQIWRGLRAYRATGAELARTYMLALLAESHLHLGQVEAGRAAVTEALALVEEHGERWWEAELYRLSGDLLLLQTPSEHEEAAYLFQRAIAIAREQEAKALELRATLRLSHLWQQEGRGKQAHTMLAAVYHGLCAGGETDELRAARTLLV